MLRGTSSLGALLVAIAAALGGGGCSSTGMTIYVDAAPGTNDGQPFFALVRQVDEAAFVTEPYETVAAKVFAVPADESVLKSAVIYPGATHAIELEQKPNGKPLAVYFLFSKPDEKWKISRAQPLPDSIEVELDGNRIKDES